MDAGARAISPIADAGVDEANILLVGADGFLSAIVGVVDGKVNGLLDGTEGMLPAVVVAADEGVKMLLGLAIDGAPVEKPNENGFVVDTVVCAPVKMLLVESGAGNRFEVGAG